VIPDPQSLSTIQENLVLEMYKKNPNLLKELMKAEGVNTSNLLSITGATKRAAETLEAQNPQLAANLRSFAQSSERKFYREGTETAGKEEEKKEPEQKSEKPEEGNKK
jgi:hypothetical protein